jgi:hypothetical protein
MDNNRNTGYLNTGNRNTGDRNTGDWNTGYLNTGNRNTGYLNTGNRNTGNWNTGDRNTGYLNTGNRNTGYLNTGNRNTGDRNTGDWNTGYWNTGYLNTVEPTEYLFFNKPCSIPRDELVFPNFFYFDLTEWIYESDMTKEEKEENPAYKTTSGYLKSREYQEAWREAWDKATDEDRKKCLTLPNWDNEIFLEISGLDVEKLLNTKDTVEIGGQKYLRSEVESKLKDLKPIK